MANPTYHYGGGRREGRAAALGTLNGDLPGPQCLQASLHSAAVPSGGHNDTV